MTVLFNHKPLDKYAQSDNCGQVHLLTRPTPRLDSNLYVRQKKRRRAGAIGLAMTELVYFDALEPVAL